MFAVDYIVAQPQSQDLFSSGGPCAYLKCQLFSGFSKAIGPTHYCSQRKTLKKNRVPPSSLLDLHVGYDIINRNRFRFDASSELLSSIISA
jgi:hypothetical protein